MQITSVFKVSRIWLFLGILSIVSFLCVPQQVYASGGEIHLTIRIPSVLAVQYSPMTYNGVKVGVSRDLRMQRAILIERTETPPQERGEYQSTEKRAESAKKVYITIHAL